MTSHLNFCYIRLHSLIFFNQQSLKIKSQPLHSFEPENNCRLSYTGVQMEVPTEGHTFLVSFSQEHQAKTRAFHLQELISTMFGFQLLRQPFRSLMHGFPSICASRHRISSPTNHFFQRTFLTGCRLLSTVQVQHPAPDFKAQAVVDGQFKELKLSDFKGKYLVLFFYPLDFTFVCPTEIIAFSDNIDKFKAINAEVVGVSTDSHFSHLAWINTPRKQGGLGDLKYPLLADFNKTISADYNVLLKEDGVALRGLFIIDPKGVVRQITINDLPVGRSVDEVLRLIKAFQFVEQHGEVCPANWQPDAATIKPTPQGSKDFFEKVN
ncbi:hypothetical protein RRG08_006656 [Elysia crispata]|uniref:Thioredoxin peroxidase n=1 Tax=Elysia crispata TaxID=231223 RepID=A0AAE0YVQ0_9GAST|nr:hypothetical protein RRG08_006656 [Elysia crispata]